ncbi:diacylglycerol kinase family protein, partial [Enterobacter hormaechei]
MTLMRRPMGRQADVTRVIRELTGVVDAIVVGGGDGSINAVLEGALAARLPLGILPLGTANDLARTLGIPPDPVAAAGIIQAGYLRQIDLGRVNGHLFANVASLGLSVELTRRLTGALKRRWGRLGYP